MKLCKYHKKVTVLIMPYSSVANNHNAEARKIVFRTYSEWPRCHRTDKELELQSLCNWGGVTGGTTTIEWFFECVDCGLEAMYVEDKFTYEEKRKIREQVTAGYDQAPSFCSDTLMWH